MKFDFYEDKAGGWRWRLVAGNGRIMADGSESYTRKEDLERAIRVVIDGVFDAEQAMGLPEVEVDK